jgi:predicted nucleic acid-binding protein
VLIVDTPVWVDYLNGISTPHTEWLERIIDQSRVGLSDVSLCEILQGIQTEPLAAGR